MQIQIMRLGNELVVEVPENLMAKAGFEVGEPLEWVADDLGRITLKRPAVLATQKTHRLSLEELLEGVPDGGVGGEYDWGPPRGVEFW